MTGSFNFSLHIIGFGLISTALLGGWILERSIRKEKDRKQKVFIGKIGRKFGILSSIASIIMLLTGIVNIFNYYGGNVQLWKIEGWLIAKIILFAFLLVNGALFGPVLIRRRTKLLEGISENTTSEDADLNIKIVNKSISSFYIVQFLLLIIILYLSILGGGKHPGIV